MFSGEKEEEPESSKKRSRDDEDYIDLTEKYEELDTRMKAVETLDTRMQALEKDKKEKDEKRRRRDPEIEITPTEEKDVLDQVLRVFIIVICDLVLTHSHHQMLKLHRRFFPKDTKKSAW